MSPSPQDVIIINKCWPKQSSPGFFPAGPLRAFAMLMSMVSSKAKMGSTRHSFT